MSNQVALSSLVVEGALLDDPFFADLASPAVRTGGLRWYGISLGGIAGAVTLAHNPWIEHGVLRGGGLVHHVGRSDTWTLFEDLMADTIPWRPPAAHRGSQLLWDPVDPASHVEALGGRSLLWQEALGDERVSNLGTEALLRGVGGVALLEPWWGPPGASTRRMCSAGPRDPRPRAPLPPEENRPHPPRAPTRPRDTGPEPGCRPRASSTPRTRGGGPLLRGGALLGLEPGALLSACGAAGPRAGRPGDPRASCAWGSAPAAPCGRRRSSPARSPAGRG